MSVNREPAPEQDDCSLAAHIGERIRQARSANQLTLQELSGRVGTHLNTVHKLEKGRGTIMLRQIEALLRVLGLELAIVPLGERVRVEEWAGWLDPEVRARVRSAGAAEFRDQALLQYVAAQAPERT